VVGVAVAYSLLVGDGRPEPRVPPVIIRPAPEQTSGATSGETLTPDGIEAAPARPATPSAGDPAELAKLFADPAKRVAGYKAAANLKKSIARYAKSRTNQCAGEITVVTDDTPLNVRTGPATSNPIVVKLPRDTRHGVLLWAPDAKNKSVKWFLLVDEASKTVKGWAYGEYCDASSVAFAK
jgi:hypothetical protein